MAVLVEEYRGEVLENVHNGRICITDSEGNIVGSVGDVEQMTYFRSSSKPIQMLPVLVRGLDRKYNLSDREITILAGSHAGQPWHLEAILSLLGKTGYQESDLIMLPSYPDDGKYRDQMLIQQLPPRKALHNCSGKHIAAMMLAEDLCGDHRDYWRPESAAQKEILHYISAFSGCPEEKIKLGVDGCGIVVFAVAQKCIAQAYTRLVCPETLNDPNISAAAKRMQKLIHENNKMMRGEGYLCSIFNEDPNIIAKGGAQGVYGFGLKKERLGVSIKIEDGTEQIWPNVIAEILRQLHYDNQDTLQKLDQLSYREIRNCTNAVVGHAKTVFHLEMRS